MAGALFRLAVEMDNKNQFLKLQTPNEPLAFSFLSLDQRQML